MNGARAVSICAFLLTCGAWGSSAPAQDCQNPLRNDTVDIVAPTEGTRVFGHAPFEVHLHTSSGDPTSVEVWINKKIRRAYSVGDASLSRLELGQTDFTLKATLGEDSTADIGDDAGINIVEVLVKSTGGCKLSRAKSFNGVGLDAHAVVIGISRYGKVTPGLQHADRDADRVEARLRALGVKIIGSLRNENATRDAILNALTNTINSASPASRFYFYFSGHGYAVDDTTYDPDADGIDHQVYLIPYDGHVDGSGSLLSLQYLMKYFRAIKASKQIFILDSCFAGRSDSLQDGWAIKSVTDARQPPATATGAALISTFSANNMTFGLLSTSPGHVSYEAPDEADQEMGGLFTHFLLEAAGPPTTGGPGPIDIIAAGHYAEKKTSDYLKLKVANYSTPKSDVIQQIPQILSLSAAKDPPPDWRSEK